MATVTNHPPIEFTEFHLFAGIGGGSLGASHARASWLGVPGTIRNIGAVDFDALACEDYRTLTGSPISCVDLFDREQYREFHGCEPPADWHEATPADIRAAAGGRCPDIVFTSPPCKGFSGLLPNKSAESSKYQALNRLTIRSIRLTLEAFADAPPRILLLENVPRIKTRGAHLLAEIKRILKKHGYTCHDADHDCGEIGGLGQRRRRYLLIARHTARCKPFVYQPPVRQLKTIGDVIGPLPLPDDSTMGPMHRLPRLKWLTWLRLALIPAGGDWRDLQKIAPEEYRIAWEPRGETKGAYHVQDWSEPSTTVTGNGAVSSSSPSTVADPRVPAKENRHHSHFAVNAFGQPGPTVTGATHVANGAPCVADVRLKTESRPNLFGVVDWDGQMPAVTGSISVSGSNCPGAIADPRLPKSKGVYPGRFGVKQWNAQASCITGDTDVQCGAQSIGDPRLTPKSPKFNHAYHVHPYDQPGDTVASGTGPSSGAICINDVRLAHSPRPGVYRIIRMDETSGAIVGGQGVGVSNGPQAIADTRLNGDSRSGYMHVLGMNEVSPAVIGAARTTASNGPSVVADHRLGCTPRGGSYGVMDWAETASAVIGSADCHAAKAAIADVRIPGNNERLDPPPVIISLDGTWHRPLTTLELLALQSFPVRFADGRPVVLAGKSDSAWRERIGNAVPPEASRRMHEQILLALLQNELGETFTLGMTPIWVQPGKQPVLKASQQRGDHS